MKGTACMIGTSAVQSDNDIQQHISTPGTGNFAAVT